MDDQQKTALANSFSNVVRQTQTPGVDVQRLAMAFRMTIDALEPGQAVELQPLFDYLVQEQKVAPQAALELCVVLKSREQKLGVSFAPAQSQAALDDDSVQKIVAGFNAKVDRSVGTWEKTGEVGTIPKSTPGTAIPKSTPGQPAWRPEPAKRGAGPRGRTPIYAGLLGIVLVSAVVFFVWRARTSEPDLEVANNPVPDPVGLRCAKLIKNDTAAICEIPKAMVDSMPRETLEAKAQITRRALGGGLKTFVVRTAEDQKIILLK